MNKNHLKINMKFHGFSSIDDKEIKDLYQVMQLKLKDINLNIIPEYGITSQLNCVNLEF